jgi:predicted SprT family Zn-dependent metalloprotease
VLVRARCSSPSIPETLDRLFAEAKRWSALWGLARLCRDADIEFSHELGFALGRCDLRQMTVTLNGLLLLKKNEGLLFETLCHELAHIAASARYGCAIQEHGPEWCEYMTRAGFTPRAVIPQAEIATC